MEIVSDALLVEFGLIETVEASGEIPVVQRFGNLLP